MKDENNGLRGKLKGTKDKEEKMLREEIKCIRRK